MLDFLRHLHLERFNHLPFVLQMHILSFAPNLPALSGPVRLLLHHHYQKRFCCRCGKPCPSVWREHKCLCNSVYRRTRRFESPIRSYQTYLRPLYVFTKPHVSFSEYQEKSLTYTDQRYFVSCNQPETVYRLVPLLSYSFHAFRKYSTSSFARTLIQRHINTNTCLRTYEETFFREVASSVRGVDQQRAFHQTRTCNFRTISERRVRELYFFLHDHLAPFSSYREMAHALLNTEARRCKKRKSTVLVTTTPLLQLVG